MNKYFLVIIFFTSLSNAADRFACKVKSDCVVSEDACYNPFALNKKFLKENEESNKKLRPLIKCQKYEGTPKENLKATCRARKCELLSDEKN